MFTILILASLAITLFFTCVITAFFLWLAVIALHAMGIFVIGSWTVAFSWPLVLLLSIFWLILKSIFAKTININK